MRVISKIALSDFVNVNIGGSVEFGVNDPLNSTGLSLRDKPKRLREWHLFPGVPLSYTHTTATTE
jgi:hypothetical protein